MFSPWHIFHKTYLSLCLPWGIHLWYQAPPHCQTQHFPPVVCCHWWCHLPSFFSLPPPSSAAPCAESSPSPNERCSSITLIMITLLKVPKLAQLNNGYQTTQLLGSYEVSEDDISCCTQQWSTCRDIYQLSLQHNNLQMQQESFSFVRLQDSNTVKSLATESLKGRQPLYSGQIPCLLLLFQWK